MELIVDAHAHVFAAAARDPRGVNELVPSDRQATLSQYQANASGAGVHKAVLVPLDENDTYVATQLGNHPDRYQAVAIASAAELGLTADDPVQHLQHRRENFPFAAVRSMWLGRPGAPLADSPANRLLAHMEAEGLVLWSYLPPDQAPLLTEVGERYPQLRVVLNHFGFTPADMKVDEHQRPWFNTGMTEQRRAEVRDLARFPQFYLMFSGHYALSHQAYPYPDIHDVGTELVGAFGTDRTLWGSDWPWIDQEPGYQAMLELVDIALSQFSADERAMIRGGTAQRLLGFAS